MGKSARTKAFKQSRLSPLQSEHADIQTQKSDYESHNDPDEIRHVERQCERAIHTIQITSKSVTGHLEALAEIDHQQKTRLRAVQVDLNLYRLPRTPDKLITFATLTISGTCEALFTASILAADGAAGIGSAVATGVTATATMISLGLFTGYGSRYLTHGLLRQVQKRTDVLKRRLALGACFSFAALACISSVAAARVRAVGRHEDIFSFSEVGLFETYNDSLSITVSIIGLLVYGVATLKGRSGLADKCPEMAELAHDLAFSAEDDGQDIVDDGLDAIDDALDDAEDAAILSAPLADEETALKARIIKFKSAVQTAKQECLAFNAQEAERQSFVAGEVIAPEPVPLPEFDCLLDGLELRPRSKPDDEIMESLRLAHTDASNEIAQAHSDFLGQLKNYRIQPPSS